MRRARVRVPAPLLTQERAQAGVDGLGLLQHDEVPGAIDHHNAQVALLAEARFLPLALLRLLQLQDHPELPDQPDEKTVFLKLRELRNDW